MTIPKLMSTPQHVDIAITGKCNLSCKYCFFADEMVSRSNLSTHQWLNFFDELGKMGVMTVCLTGGEVFTRPDLFELIDGIIANHMRYQLLSNGTMITEDTLAKFAVGKRRQRLDSIQISVDGSRPEVHDLSRPRSFGRALRGLKLLKDAGFPVEVRVTINRYNVDDLENVAHLLLDEIGLAGFSTNEAYACGETDRTEGDIILTPAQRKKAMLTLARLDSEYNSRLSAQAGPLVYIRELERIDALMATGTTVLPGRGMMSACGGVFKQLGVMHDGTIVPCITLSTLHLGKIGVDSLQEVWLNHPVMVSLRQRKEIPLSTVPYCQDCSFQGFCAGGCPAGAYFVTGDLNTCDKRSCFKVLKEELLLEE